jgi:hypothetical protein
MWLSSLTSRSSKRSPPHGQGRSNATEMVGRVLTAPMMSRVAGIFPPSSSVRSRRTLAMLSPHWRIRASSAGLVRCQHAAEAGGIAAEDPCDFADAEARARAIRRSRRSAPISAGP